MENSTVLPILYLPHLVCLATAVTILRDRHTYTGIQYIELVVNPVDQEFACRYSEQPFLAQR